MKKIHVMLFFLIPVVGLAQDCGNFYFFQSNKTVEMSLLTRKGNPNGKQVYTVSNVQTTPAGTTSTVNSENFNSDGKSTNKAVNNMTCAGGMMMMDMRMQMSGEEQKKYGEASAKVDKVYIEYPGTMKVGDNLKDAAMHMDMTINNAPTTVDMTIFERKVEANEKITTPAGDYNCFKITFRTKSVVKTMIGTMGIPVTVKVDVSEWFSPGFGIVKSESKYGSSILNSVK
ncbi:MAG: hypothetical protein ACHQRM_12325 [Bacteroidia bacterium]